ncbi:MAG: hydratase [Deltaproteobacteria bacterium]|nr:hydratase [Deltaproteobacteria bacterium]
MNNAQTIKAAAVAAALLFFASGCAAGAIKKADSLSTSYLKGTPHAKGSGIFMGRDGALKMQRRFLAKISNLGSPVGYKAALTNPKMQEKFGVTEPVLGVLLHGMLVKDKAHVKASYGARPFAEADIIVRVSDRAINNAKTPEEAFEYIDLIIPFIELPDLVYMADIKMTANDIIAANAGARLGVMGGPVALPPGSARAAYLKYLRNSTIEVFDYNGNLVTEGRMDSILEDPMNAVLWIRDEVLRRGLQLKEGDLLSLGSITAPIKVEPGVRLKAVYTGLDGPGSKASAEVYFEY